MPGIAFAAVAFAATNIDDLFVLVFLYIGATTGKERLAILCGRYAGTALLLAVSALTAFGLGLFAERYLGLLGLIPIALGIKEIIALRCAKEEKEAEGKSARGGSMLLSATVLTLSSGADNIGVYTPLLAGYSAPQMLLFLGIFAVMTALWCLLGVGLVRFPSLREKLQKYKGILVPLVLILLGIYVLVKNFCF